LFILGICQHIVLTVPRKFEKVDRKLYFIVTDGKNEELKATRIKLRR